jgi:FMN phosphatase YigB (HAD superfamily)
MIRAITFDFWDTIVRDDSDEPKRAALGLASKAETRLQLLTAEIARYHPELEPQRVKTAFEQANQRFNHRWQVDHVTSPVATRLGEAFSFLKIEPTPGFDAVVRAIEQMEVEIPPDFAPGIGQTLADLARDYPLGLISDTIHTPGRGLRQILEREGLLQYFKHCVFSDEVGAAKPAPVVFERAAAGLGVPLAQIAHVGDRESNDVAGPLALGMAAILYTGLVDRGSATTRATAICRNFADLPRIVSRLSDGAGP